MPIYQSTASGIGTSAVQSEAVLRFYSSAEDDAISQTVFDGIPFYNHEADGFSSHTFSSAGIVDYQSVYVRTPEVDCTAGNIPFESV
jgi:hypothetical protein